MGELTVLSKGGSIVCTGRGFRCWERPEVDAVPATNVDLGNPRGPCASACLTDTLVARSVVRLPPTVGLVLRARCSPKVDHLVVATVTVAVVHFAPFGYLQDLLVHVDVAVVPFGTHGIPRTAALDGSPFPLRQPRVVLVIDQSLLALAQGGLLSRPCYPTTPRKMTS